MPTAAGVSPAATSSIWATIWAISASVPERSVGRTSGSPITPPRIAATDDLGAADVDADHEALASHRAASYQQALAGSLSMSSCMRL